MDQNCAVIQRVMQDSSWEAHMMDLFMGEQCRWRRLSEQEFPLTCCADNIQHNGPLSDPSLSLQAGQQISRRSRVWASLNLWIREAHLMQTADVYFILFLATKTMLDHELRCTSELLAVRSKCTASAWQDGKVSVQGRTHSLITYTHRNTHNPVCCMLIT